jgi:hypothetical protein
LTRLVYAPARACTCACTCAFHWGGTSLAEARMARATQANNSQDTQKDPANGTSTCQPPTHTNLWGLPAAARGCPAPPARPASLQRWCRRSESWTACVCVCVVNKVAGALQVMCLLRRTTQVCACRRHRQALCKPCSPVRDDDRGPAHHHAVQRILCEG